MAGSLSLLPLLGCSREKDSAPEPKLASALTEKTSKLEQRIPQLLAELRVPGLSVVVIENGGIAWRRGFGVMNGMSQTPVDNDTIFPAQSMSKPVFAYAAMKLCDKGVLNLDTPLVRYVPNRFVQDDPRADLITARHVLSHTTGLPNWRSQKDPLKITFKPGERWSYSGEAYYYLQSIVTALKGRTDTTTCNEYEQDYRVCATNFDEYMTANLLRPFGMTSSGYVWRQEFQERMAHPHDTNGMLLKSGKSTSTDVARYGSAGSLVTTPTDYAKFLIEVMDPKPADDYRLTNASLREMLRPHADVPGSPVRSSWALGWQILHLDPKDVICHGGDIEGFHSLAAFSAVSKSGFVIMTNGENGYEIIWKRLLGDLVDLFV